MLFNSAIFLLIFLPVTFSGFLFFRKFKLGEIALFWLVLCSLFFYGWWKPVYLMLIVFSMVANYALGYQQGKCHRSGKASKTVLVVSLVFNLGLLGYFKYMNFFIDTLNMAAGTGLSFPELALPLGISFFTFQQITYQVDAYKGKAEEYSFIHYCLFVSFFPQLVAGPIVHHKQMMGQFLDKTRVFITPERVTLGMVLLSIGLFKKTVIADNLAAYASPVFGAASQGKDITFFEGWGGTLAYTFQIYFDFSGYSDMAVGLACLFGIMLPLNFFSPYQAGNIIDFWRRWHITLSTFLKDYVYIPLGGNRHGHFNRYRNLLLTMLIGGLWHGAGWTFIFWGGCMGFI